MSAPVPASASGPEGLSGVQEGPTAREVPVGPQRATEGSLVRWESDGQWFTARVTGEGSGLVGSLAGVVVDPGNFIGGAWVSPYYAEERLTVGQAVPNLLPDLITVIEKGESNG